MSSPVWERWTAMTDKYNATSLTQVFAEYFREHSVGDIGGPDNQYSPMPGYAGTLAPGEHYEDVYALKDLPKRLLHPWPAAQEVPFHLRWPVPHPFTPGTLLWLALNEAFVDVSDASIPCVFLVYFMRYCFAQSYAEEELKRLENSEIVGGQHMEPGDAIRIGECVYMI